MFSLSVASFRRVIRIGLLLSAAVAILLAIRDTTIGWVIPLTLGGGVIAAGIRLALRRPLEHAPMSHDIFEGENAFGVLNMSRLRVAGVGGVGLMFMAALVAFQFALTAFAVVAGIAGGCVIALAMIRYRRRPHDSLLSPFDAGGSPPPGLNAVEHVPNKGRPSGDARRSDAQHLSMAAFYVSEFNRSNRST